MEVEFIAQTLQLVAGTAKARSPVTAQAFHFLAREKVISRDDAQVLIAADEYWRSLQSMLRLLCGPTPPIDPAQDLPSATLDLLCRSMNVSGIDVLATDLAQLAETVRALFVRLIGPVEPDS